MTDLAYPVFDPKNPELFKRLWRSQHSALSKKDKAAYDAEQAKRDAYFEAERVARLQRPRTATEKQAREYGEAVELVKLGAALEEEGFTVQYKENRFGGDAFEHHPDWARVVIIRKDDQAVGYITPWCPQGSLSRRFMGWLITTLRHTEYKRYKKIAGAVKHINATAIPTQQEYIK